MLLSCAPAAPMGTHRLGRALSALSKLEFGFPTELEQSSAALFPLVFPGSRGFVAWLGEITTRGTVQWIQFPRRGTSNNATCRRSKLHLQHSWWCIEFWSPPCTRTCSKEESAYRHTYMHTTNLPLFIKNIPMLK